MKDLRYALLYGLVMFSIGASLIGVGCAIVTLWFGEGFDSESVLLILNQGFSGGSCLGVFSFLLAYFGSHRRVGEK